jgi:predicted O-methyltransferase YrrM
MRRDLIRSTVRDVVDRVAGRIAASLSVRNAEQNDRFRQEIAELVRAECDRVVRALHDVEFRSRRDIFAAAERHAVESTERFVRRNLPKAPAFPEAEQTLRHALSLAPPDGMALEFGVFSGRTLGIIADARAGKDVFGFDSFLGLPEDWRTNIPAGTFRRDELPDVPGAELVVGWFADTLPGFLDQHPDTVAFLHLDADLYSSTRTVLDGVGPRLRPGSVVLFDEYFNYPGWEEHEHRAWCEFVDREGIAFEYLAYTGNFEQLAIRVTG